MSRPVAREGALRWATMAVVVAILVVTLRPVGSNLITPFKWCIGCSELGTLDLIYNMALFAPLGFMLGLRRASALQALGIAVGLSTLVELLQLVAVPGRDPTLSDIVANSLGGALGVPLARTRGFLRRQSATQWRIVAWSWVALGIAAIAIGAWAISVHAPESDYYVQWLPRRQGYTRFGGELRALQANGVNLEPAAVIPSQRFPEEFFQAGPDASARLTPGPHTSGMAYIARLALEYAEFFMLARQNDALVVRYRTQAPRVGLRSPILALAGTFTQDSAAEITVRAIKRKEHVELSATRPGDARPYAVRRDRLTAARLWTTLLPFEHGFGSLGVFGDVLWMAILTGPAAYAGVRARAGVLRLLPTAFQVTGLALFAAVVEPSLWWWPVWLGVVVGVLAGVWLGTRRAASPKTVPAT